MTLNKKKFVNGGSPWHITELLRVNLGGYLLTNENTSRQGNAVHCLSIHMAMTNSTLNLLSFLGTIIWLKQYLWSITGWWPSKLVKPNYQTLSRQNLNFLRSRKMPRKMPPTKHIKVEGRQDPIICLVKHCTRLASAAAWSCVNHSVMKAKVYAKSSFHAVCKYLYKWKVQWCLQNLWVGAVWAWSGYIATGLISCM